MTRLLVIDDRDTTIEMCGLGHFDYVTRCDRAVPCQVCEERDRGCPLKCAHDYREAEEALAKTTALPDLVVLDLHFGVAEERLLPEDKSDLPTEPAERKRALEPLRRRQGRLILERLRASYPSLPVVLLTTTAGDSSTGKGANTASSRDPLVHLCEHEVVDSRTLAAEVSRALELSHRVQEGPIFWGASRAMAELRRQLGTLARSPLPLLLTGETGTGKSFLAEHFIHPRSGAKGPLVVTDLSTIPATLLPAHLFGARRGSYTGATEDTAGVFEQAHGGTLFLDEVANLDLDLQRQLLLVLERGKVTRLGESRARPVVVKVVAATHADLDALVRAGRFRHDLFMRLHPATRLRVPALRERREDLPELVRFALLDALRSPQLAELVRTFLARFPTPDDFRADSSTVTVGKPSHRGAPRDAFAIFLAPRAHERLVAHAWPGNQRELRMVATSALVFALVESLDAADAIASGRGRGATTGTTGARASERAPAVLAIGEALIDRLLDGPAAPSLPGDSEAPRAIAAGEVGALDVERSARAVSVEVRRDKAFQAIATSVERQYMTSLFRAHDGDLAAMAEELVGSREASRRVLMRLNQLGLSIRDLRKALAAKGA